ncbi:MAG: thymidine kinase [Myxococcota bacterium]|jgi:thymidine kinase|nr:thymidine kinase [Myxococcota bacterium]
MAKLYFRHGTVGSAKTLNLLAVAHNYEQQGKRVALIKPQLDVRFSLESVRSRAGLERAAELVVDAESVIDRKQLEGLSCILVDEAQFLSAFVIEQLRQISIELDIPVICYGLRTTFKAELFEGAKRLFELADAIEEVKTTCMYCNRKGVFNLKLCEGEPTVDGETVDLGTEEKYVPTCCRCYVEKLGEKAPMRRTPL